MLRDASTNTDATERVSPGEVSGVRRLVSGGSASELGVPKAELLPVLRPLAPAW